MSLARSGRSHSSSHRRHRLIRPRLVAVAALTIIAQGLPVLPFVATPTPAHAVGIQIVPPGEPPPPLSDADRVPPLAPQNENGVMDPTSGPPDLDRKATPQADVADNQPLPADGGVNYDTYGTGPNDAQHIAVVFPGQANEQAPDGTWQDVQPTLTPDQTGWTGSGPAFTSELPSALGPASPVSFSLGAGTLTSVPEGIDPSAPVQGTATDLTVTYPAALPSADFIYTVGVEGLKEQVVLQDPSAPSTITYDLQATGFTLAADPTGRIGLYQGTTLVGFIPTPTATDSSAEPQTSTATFALTDLGSGAYQLQLTVDPAFLQGATYPVTVDPGTDIRYPTRDTYVDQNNPSSSYEGLTTMKVGSPYYSFVRFGTSDLQVANRIVYQADLWVYDVSQGSQSTVINAKRVTAAWPATGTMTWNNMPAVGSTVYATDTTDANNWFTLDMKQVYQHYLDTTWTDQGVRLGSTDTKTLDSVEAGGTARPELVLQWNDLPNIPSLKGPDNGVTVQTGSPTLTLNQIPTDPNGDSVLVQYQVSDSATDFTGSHLQWQSGWTDETSQVVPAGVLVDGQTYYWRAQSWDVCIEPDQMCSLTDGAGVTRTQSASGARSFIVSLKHYGSSSSWAMWSKPLGDGMALKVNESNGNLYLHMALDSVATPIGPLAFGLSYNSENNDDQGLGSGWVVSAGPDAGPPSKLPTKLVTTSNADDGIDVYFGGGNKDHYPHTSGRVYTGVGMGAGLVKKNKDGTFAFDSPDGTIYTFDSSGKLTGARGSYAKDGLSTNSFAYQFNANAHLTRVTDPMGRALTLTWSGTSPEQLTSIKAWDHVGNGNTLRTWTIAYNTSNQVKTVTDPDGNIVTLTYDSTAGNNMSTIKDGYETATGGPGWTVGYQLDPNGYWRVHTLLPPSGTHHWAFDYVGPYKGSTAAEADVTDPRGVATTDANDYETKVQFNWAGLPIEISGPADQNGYWPITTQVWDSNNNLICQRSPAANAYNLACTVGTTTQGPLNTVYSYATDPPYRLLSVNYPTPDTAGQLPNNFENYTYDGGNTFPGLWEETFSNNNMSGLPAAEKMWPNATLLNDWGTGSPAGVSNIDNWSVRLTGLLHIDTTHTYHFRLYSDDGAALTVSDTTLVDCFGQANVFANYNCNSGHDATKKLWPGDKAITIEFSELTGSAKIELQWDQGTGAPMTDVPSSVLSPNLGLMTQEDGPKLRTTWTYPDDDAKSRRLPASMTLHALWDSSLVDRTTTYTYDDYGRKLTQITASGSANPETTTYAYTNDPTCMTSVTDPAGGVTNYTCDEAGDVTQVSRVIRAVVAQPAQTRMVTKTYNAEGLVASVTLPANQTGTPNVQNTYDKAGRIKETDRLIKLDDLGNPVLAVTKYTYDDEGRLVTKTLPDPDGSGPIAAPVYSYAYDGADNQTQVTDPLGYVTNTDYDALNRPFQVTSPTGLVSTTNYKLVQAGTFYNQQNVTDPAGVKTVTQLDILGEKTSVQVGSSPTTYTTTYAYDAVGNVTSVTDPAGITVSKTWDAFGELTQKTRPFTATQNAITTYTYDNRGFLSSVDGPRTDVNDKLVYGHDDVGRITSAQFVDWPSGITVVYDDTGEKVKVVQPLNGAVNHIRNWTYDVNGRMVSSTDGVSGTPATTTYGYNQAGWLKWVGDPRNYSLCYVYDNAGERTERYGVAGTNPSSDCSLTSPTKLSDESFQYDLDEEMTQASEGSPTPTSTTSITWDKEGRVKTVAQTGPGASTTTYNYLVGTTVTSQLQSLSVAIGANTYTTSYRYDPATGDLSSMTDPFSGGTTTYGYDGAGRPSTRTDPDGLQWTRTYDQYSGRLSFQSIKTTPTPPTNPTVRASETLTYDIAGEVIQKEEHVGSNPDNTDAANNQPWHYTYDAAGRMITAVGPRSVTTTYGYDNSGDRTSVQVGQTGTQVTTSYDAYGRPSSTSDNATFTSDQVGNLLSVTGSGASGYGAFAYGYDLWGRLTASCPSGTPGAACPVGGANTIAYGSDALDRTVSRKVGTANPATTAYVGETQDPAQVVDSSTTPATTTTYEYDPGGPFSLQQGTTVSYVLSDLHSDVVALAASDGTLPSTFSYDPWGIPKSQTGSGTTYMASVGSLGFQGDPTDPTTALVDMGARSYDANMGEFTQLDTVFGKLKHPLSLNQYVYATDDPISHVDPDGLCSQPDVCPPLPFVQKSGTASQAYSSEVPQREPDPSASAPFAPTTALAPDISVRDPVGTYFRPGLEGTLWSDPAYDKLSENDSPWADQLQPVPSGTIGFCVGASIDLLFFHLGGSVCVQISTSGAIGGTATWGSGLSSQPLGASIGFSLQGSTASHIQDLGGPFTEVGVAGPYRGPTVGVNGFTGQSCGQTVRGADFTFGYSQGLLSGEGSYSHTHTATLGDHDPACPSG